MSVDANKTALCRECLTRRLVTDHASADILCSECGAVWGKWSPEHAGDMDPERAFYKRASYFETVLANQLGFDCHTFTANEMAAVRRMRPGETAWDVGKVRACTRKLKYKHLTRSAGRMAHALKFGVAAKYPRLHHLERAAMGKMFCHVAEVFDRIKSGTRKNLVSYAFVVGKLLEEVGRLEDFEHLVVPIKTASKRRFAERVWAEAMLSAPWRNKVWRYDNVSVREFLKT